jgi:hypothetical protein
MTISLAFLAPDLVKAAIDGRLPHGMGVARLCDLPAEWSRQHQMLGLTSLRDYRRLGQRIVTNPSAKTGTGSGRPKDFPAPEQGQERG